MDNVLGTFINLFLLFLVIFDPFMSLASFIAMTKSFNEERRRSIALMATMLAGLLLAIILLTGTAILDILAVEMRDFLVAGGIVLAILGLKMVLGQDLVAYEQGHSESAISTIIAMPMITGPAAIMATILSVSQYGTPIVSIAILCALIVVSLILFFSTYVYKFMGQTALTMVSTILGLITLAWGISYIRQGILGV